MDERLSTHVNDLSQRGGMCIFLIFGADISHISGARDIVEKAQNRAPQATLVFAC